ncbi:hypothetical protein PWO95_01905 [Weissella paramesenteroides]|uniref:hypothetical protein n=1 Tax=Weissella paramesenteroides TaxID=1249 RepID=UPI0023A9432F|nr:hypothetical protein [Weissella paramesenteroides]WEA53332.1 hypothetical protein PWO95_01905 [Weissella paramesenteroides]
METPELTNDAQKLAVLMYKQYKKNLDDGQSKQNAKSMGSLENVHNILNIKYSLDDTLDLVRELSKAHYLDVIWASNTAYLININNLLIIYGENRIANNVKAAFEWAMTITAPFKF